MSRLGLVAIIGLTPFLFSCSDHKSRSSVNAYTADGEYVKSIDDLEEYECSSNREGIIVYLSSEDTRMVCYKGNWIDYSKWQSISGVNSSSSSIKNQSSSSVEYGSAGYDSLIISRYGSSYLGSVESFLNLPECNDTMNYRVAYVEDMETYLRCNGIGRAHV